MLVREAKEEMIQQLSQIMNEMGQCEFDALINRLDAVNQVLEKREWISTIRSGTRGTAATNAVKVARTAMPIFWTSAMAETLMK